MRKIITIGLDIAEQVFQRHGIDTAGRIAVRRKLRRCDVVGFLQSIGRCLVGIEACGSGDYWARELVAFGHDV